jgi:hypothetical protein
METRYGHHVIARGQSVSSSDLTVHGWIAVHGMLRVVGELRCLALTVEPGARVSAGRIVTNVLEVNNRDAYDDPAIVETSALHARVVKLVGVVAPLGLSEELGRTIAAGRARADYVQHLGGDHSPSWSYESGSRSVLSPDVARDTAHGFFVSVPAIVERLTRGETPFTSGEVLVPFVEAPARRRAFLPYPSVIELESWLGAHPGPQRELATDLVVTWAARLARAPREAVPGLRRALCRALSSPTLAEQRAQLLARLPPA